MCNTHSNGQAHGVRSDLDKAMADLRDDLIEELKLVTKYDAQIPVIASEDFPQVDDVVHILGHIRDEHKHAVTTLIDYINRLDGGPKSADPHSHDDKHEHSGEHAHQH